jgi:hypothetical protein
LKAYGKLKIPAPMAQFPRLNTDAHAETLPSTPTAIPPIVVFHGRKISLLYDHVPALIYTAIGLGECLSKLPLTERGSIARC